MMNKLADISLFQSLQNSSSDIQPEQHGSLVIRRVEPSEAGQVLAILHKHFPDYFDRRAWPMTIEEWQHIDPSDVIATGAFDGDKLVGYVELDSSPTWERLAKSYCDVPNDITAGWQWACVDEKYRGTGLQRILYQYAERLLRDNIRYIEVSAHPENVPSHKNISRSGFSKLGTVSDSIEKAGKELSLDVQDHDFGSFDYFLKDRAAHAETS